MSWTTTVNGTQKSILKTSGILKCYNTGFMVKLAANWRVVSQLRHWKSAYWNTISI